MVDDNDDALKDVYLAQSEHGAVFPLRGQFFNFASSGDGHPPSCKHWKKEDRPDCVIPVGSWKEATSYQKHTIQYEAPGPTSRERLFTLGLLV